MKTPSKVIVAMMCLPFAAMPAHAQAVSQDEKEEVNWTPKVGGTIRAKFEDQYEEKESRFEVRTARINFTGNVTQAVSYKAEIDLCDEGAIKMLDAYVRLKPWKTLTFTIGQERVPFTIDAHRSPHQQYFANRSFIAKQVGNVRDVGAELGYTFNVGFPIIVNAGTFNGSGLTNQKNYWTKGFNYSAKVQFLFPNVNLVLSTQKVKPDDVTVTMYDAGITYHRGGFIAEAEYLYKHYAHGAYHGVDAFDSFVSYDIPVRTKLMTKVSPLVRYDYMGDHSDGKRYGADDSGNPGQLKTNDYKRSRITGGLTFSFHKKPFTADVRLNYEKYLYRKDAVKATSERDKIVMEFITHF